MPPWPSVNDSLQYFRQKSKDLTRWLWASFQSLCNSVLSSMKSRWKDLPQRIDVRIECATCVKRFNSLHTRSILNALTVCWAGIWRLGPLPVAPDTLTAHQVLFHANHDHQAPACALGSISNQYPTNSGNHFSFIFSFSWGWGEGGKRKNENANKWWQIATECFSSATCEAEAWHPTATNYFHVSPS